MCWTTDTIPRTSSTTTFRRFAPFLLLTVVVCGIYANSLGNGFIWDDNLLIVENVSIRSLSNIPRFFGFDYWTHHRPIDVPGDFRPVRAATFALDYALWELNPSGYHATNMLLHLCNTWLLFIVLTQVVQKLRTPGPGDSSPSPSRRFIPLAAALLFASHPALTESISWIKNRSELLALFFSLLTVLALFADRETFSRLARAALFGTSLACYVLAVFSKETALVLPPAILLFKLFADGRIDRKTLLTIAPFLLVIPLFVWFKLFFLNASTYQGLFASPSLPEHAGLVIRTLDRYLGILVLPADLTIDRNFHLDAPFPDSGPPWFAAAFLALPVIALYRGRCGIVLFSVLLTGIALLPVANILIIWARPVAEQRLYFPAVGYGLFVASLMAASGERIASGKNAGRRGVFVAVVIAAVVIGIQGFLVMDRNRDWRNEYTIWLAAFMQNPENQRAVHFAVSEIDKWSSAEKRIEAFDHILNVRPDTPAVLFRLANEYLALGKFRDALPLYEEVLRNNPNHARALNNLGILHQRMEQIPEAIRYYETALAADPWLAAPYQNLSMIHFDQGRYGKAVEYIDNAIGRGLHIDSEYLIRLEKKHPGLLP